MSLTRAQWVEMWTSLEIIKNFVYDHSLMPMSMDYARVARHQSIQEIHKIQAQIQSVVGQMEEH